MNRNKTFGRRDDRNLPHVGFSPSPRATLWNDELPRDFGSRRGSPSPIDAVDVATDGTGCFLVPRRRNRSPLGGGGF
jgi:hypothetical protein